MSCFPHLIQHAGERRSRRRGIPQEMLAILACIVLGYLQKQTNPNNKMSGSKGILPLTMMRSAPRKSVSALLGIRNPPLKWLLAHVQRVPSTLRSGRRQTGVTGAWRPTSAGASSAKWAFDPYIKIWNMILIIKKEAIL